MADLDACEREQIHIPGAIQPHGALLAVTEPELKVVVHSANTADFFGLTGSPNGLRLHDLLSSHAISTLESCLSGDPRDFNPIEVGLEAEGGSLTCVAHRSSGLLVLEFEPAETEPPSFTSAYRRLVHRFERLRRAREVQEVCDLAAQEIRAMTGFDRVMVYRFDTDSHGEVVAQSRVDDSVESYLGLHYPSSDIPAQARRLYVVNPVRIIVDADYAPVALVPQVSPVTRTPLDLTHSTLRSVSPVHCEYLANMGVRASMSISLIKDDQLWGLIACHNRTPLYVAYATRLAGEFLANVLSARISEMENLETFHCKSLAHGIQARLIDQLVSAPRWQDGVAGSSGTTLMELLQCDGAAILYQGEVTGIGSVPPERFIRDLGDSLSDRDSGTVIATDRLSETFAVASRHLDCAAGVLAVPLSAEGADLIFWFRGERLREVTWAGDPTKPAVATDDGTHVGPRRSFAAWKELVRGRSEPWSAWEIQVAAELRTALIASIMHQAAELERMNRRLVSQGKQRDRFLASVSHELRNPVDAILGWTRVARSDAAPETLARALETIDRNARMQAQLIEDLLDASQLHHGRLRLEQEPFSLARVVQDAANTIEPSARQKHIRIDVDVVADNEIHGDPSRVQQVVWNLLSNAVKYSAPGSRVHLRVRREDDQAVVEVSDQGEGMSAALLPRIFEPFRQGDLRNKTSGLGIGLSIAKSIVELHGGSIAAASPGVGEGSTFIVSLPVSGQSHSTD